MHSLPAVQARGSAVAGTRAGEASNPFSITDRALDWTVRQWEIDGALPATLMADVVKAAIARRAVIAQMLPPGEMAACWRWLEAFMVAGSYPRAPVTEEGVTNAVRGIWETCRDLPAAVWCDETRIAFQRTQKWFPTPAEVFTHLSHYSVMLRSQRNGCDAVIRAWEAQKGIEKAQAAIEPATPEAVARVEAVLADFRSAGGQPAYAPPSTARPLASARALPLDDRALLATLEASIAGTVDDKVRGPLLFRRDALRRKLGLGPAETGAALTPATRRSQRPDEKSQRVSDGGKFAGAPSSRAGHCGRRYRATRSP